MVPRCQYHPGVPMQRVAATHFRMYGKPKPPTHKSYRCSVSGCPFVLTVEKPEPKPRYPCDLFPKVRKRLRDPFNPKNWM